MEGIFVCKTSLHRMCRDMCALYSFAHHECSQAQYQFNMEMFILRKQIIIIA